MSIAVYTPFISPRSSTTARGRWTGMGRKRVGFLGTGARAGALFVALVIIAGFALDIGAARGSPGSGTATVVRVGDQAVPESCSQSAFARLSVTPASVAALPLQNQIFAATAENACGDTLAQPVSFSWSLSSLSLGTLNASGGSTIAYTACVAPMNGVLHVEATSGGVTLYANASISVADHAPFAQNTSPAPQGAPWAAVGIVCASFALAAAVL